jgi:hypothetical protein
MELQDRYKIKKWAEFKWGGNEAVCEAYELGAEHMSDAMNVRIKHFVLHLCNTKVIYLYTPDQLLTIFQQNNFGE